MSTNSVRSVTVFITDVSRKKTVWIGVTQGRSKQFDSVDRDITPFCPLPFSSSLGICKVALSAEKNAVGVNTRVDGGIM